MKPIPRVLPALALGGLLAVTLPGTAPGTASADEAWADYSSFISPITPAMATNLQAIAAAGIAAGREPGRMGQIGDSITESAAYFRNVLLSGPTNNETGHDYDPIRSWLAYGGSQPADGNSFYNLFGKGGDYGCKSGWKLPNAVVNGHPDLCVNIGDGATPGNFAWALIMFGTNDIDGGWGATEWKADFKAFVQEFIDLGVLPVLSTIPPEVIHIADGRVEALNTVVIEIAQELQIPWVDYYGLILHYQPTTWHGTLIGSDGTHPSAGGGGTDFSETGLTTTDGYAARTKLTLDMAELLRTEVFDHVTSVQGESWGRVRNRYR